MEAQNVDFAAVGRIASRVEFRDIRLSELSASGSMRVVGDLHPDVQHACAGTKRDGDLLEVSCSYQVRVTSGTDAEALKANFIYLMSYSLVGDEPVSDDDLQHFAYANGTYHSWPFVRQLLFDLTSRMGYPPYSLPVFKFFPKRPKPAEPPAPPASPETPQAEGEHGEAEEAKAS